jgi:hypothetical protein
MTSVVSEKDRKEADYEANRPNCIAAGNSRIWMRLLCVPNRAVDPKISTCAVETSEVFVERFEGKIASSRARDCWTEGF